MSFKSSFTIPAVAALCFCSSGGTMPALADIINVPGDAATIQGGIDLAVNGDEVVVADGIYTGEGNRDIDFGGKLITVRSVNGPDNCVIDCQGTFNDPHRGFYFHSGETNDAVLDGFTIRNGSMGNFGNETGRGGGIHCDTSSPTITNCMIVDNSVSSHFESYGGGIYSAYGSPTITNCTISGNAASTADEAGFGGGIYCEGGSPTIANCVISGNFAGSVCSPGPGGGIRCSGGSPTIIDCIITDNSAGIGGGIAFFSCTATITNCSIGGNVASFYDDGGGGMYNSFSSPVLTNCAFYQNSARAGGGMYNASNSSPTLTDCTFSQNTATGNGGGMINAGSSNPSVTNCILWGDSSDEIFGEATVTYSNVQGGWLGVGNIDVDPLFVDPDNGDYRLMSGSPSIDAGNNWGVPIDANDYDEDGLLCELFPVDLDGNPRFNADEADFDPGCGVPVVVDMGAYEYQFDPVENVIFADLNADGAVGVADLLALLASWGLCGKGCCLADLDIDSTVGVSDLLALLANWGPCP